MGLEESIADIEDDELGAVAPKIVRLRKPPSFRTSASACHGARDQKASDRPAFFFHAARLFGSLGQPRQVGGRGAGQRSYSAARTLAARGAKSSTRTPSPSNVQKLPGGTASQHSPVSSGSDTTALPPRVSDQR